MQLFKALMANLRSHSCSAPWHHGYGTNGIVSHWAQTRIVTSDGILIFPRFLFDLPSSDISFCWFEIGIKYENTRVFLSL